MLEPEAIAYGSAIIILYVKSMTLSEINRIY